MSFVFKRLRFLLRLCISLLHVFGMLVTVKVLVRKGILEVWLYSGTLIRFLPFKEFLVITQISMVATALDSGETILVTNIYAPIDSHGKIHLWDHIRYVCSCAPYFPWILGGDFNSILSLEEKRGGWARLGTASNLFQAQVYVLFVIDVKPSNGVFTGKIHKVVRKLFQNVWIGFLFPVIGLAVT